MRTRLRPTRLPGLVVCAAIAVLGSSCAYYNTYYLAKRYYGTATEGLPYSVEKPTGAQTGNYQKSIDYSKKLITSYPKSKYVDDAYLLWARGLLGKEDPLQTINMLVDYSARYPNSPLKDEARFYLGVAYRQARKYREALVPLDEFIGKQPDHELAPYAHLERARALAALDRPEESALAATQIIERYPKSPLQARALAIRAEAQLAGGNPEAARQDFQTLGLRATDDDQRFTYLLREADCLEAARNYVGELALIEGALAHEPPPVKGPGGTAPTGPGADRYGQLTLRRGTAHLLAGRPEQALGYYRNVIQDYPKTPLAAEAQYRIGYAQETVLDDFEAARQEYARVRDQSVSSGFFAQAMQRQQNLDRLARYRSASGDSVERQVEAGFLLAEQYLFQLDKPDRAIEAYSQIARDHAGTPSAAKALNAAAWIYRRKYDQPATADSLLWAVVRQYPATEAQLAARDYLEAAGHTVPTELIKLPERPVPVADTTIQLTPPPQGPMPLGAPQAGPAVLGTPDSLAGRSAVTAGPSAAAPSVAPAAGAATGAAVVPALTPQPFGPAPAPAGSAPAPSAVPQPPPTAQPARSPLDDPPRPPGETPVPSPPPSAKKPQ